MDRIPSPVGLLAVRSDQLLTASVGCWIRSGLHPFHRTLLSASGLSVRSASSRRVARLLAWASINRAGS